MWGPVSQHTINVHRAGAPTSGLVYTACSTGIRIRTFYLTLHTKRRNNALLGKQKDVWVGTLIDPKAKFTKKLPLSQWRSLVSPRSERTTSHTVGLARKSAVWTNTHTHLIATDLACTFLSNAHTGWICLPMEGIRSLRLSIHRVHSTPLPN
jgi:hypothetical protein